MSQTIAKGTLKTPTRSDLVARLRAHADEIRGQGIVSLAIFGSRARGDERPDSDLDVLMAYDPERPFTLYVWSASNACWRGSPAPTCTSRPATASARSGWTAF